MMNGAVCEWVCWGTKGLVVWGQRCAVAVGVLEILLGN